MRKLRIENFKCFKDKTINFRNLTVLAGGNGAGKSTIIQTLLILLQTHNAKNFDFVSRKLYINDYYCELGNSGKLLHYEFEEEKIKFTLYDKKERYSIIECIDNKEDLSILEIVKFDETKGENDSLNFLKYFDFIGADRFGPKTFHHTDSNFSVINVGKFGEYTALVLNKYKFQPISNTDGDLLKNVNYWLTEIFKYTQIDTIYVKEANIAMIKIKNHPKGDYESPVNMPYGVSYLLPIIVSCLVRQIPKDRLFENYIHEDENEENELIVIENPEAHLHPFAQSKLGYFLAKMSKHVQIIIETHSEHIINGIRLATLEEDIDQNEIIINFLESNEDSIQPNIKEILIDQFSDLTDWPRGFFDQQEADISKIFKHKRELKNAH
jgi:predicted ATPase